MSLTLYGHPLSSFVHKALIALYETGAPFKQEIVNFGDVDSATAFKKLWPIGKIPVLRDEAQDRTVPEASIIIEYLAQHYAGSSTLIPRDPDLARQMRLRDRFFDLYVQVPMQKIVGDRLRPPGTKDPYGVEEARTLLRTALDMVESEAGARWIMGDQFTMADCAAAPALFYADLVMPFGDKYPRVVAYLARLRTRPSYARVLKEAEPYMHLVPKE